MLRDGRRLLDHGEDGVIGRFFQESVVFTEVGAEPSVAFLNIFDLGDVLEAFWYGLTRS